MLYNTRVHRFTRDYEPTEIPPTVVSKERENDYPIPQHLTYTSLNEKKDYIAISAQPPLDILPRGLLPHLVPRRYYPPMMHYGWRIDDEHTARAEAYYNEHTTAEEPESTVTIWQTGFRLMVEHKLGLRLRGPIFQTASGITLLGDGPSNDVLALYSNYCLALAAPNFPDDTIKNIQQLLGFEQDPKWFLDMCEDEWIYGR
ncbi:hypothetical protein A0H81_13395 [Grifola frondosa]|uniref:Uncharacterized protein n=1 Tax=Grifola frondosa TaxID=5627 RepID=A0A1C7LPH9_GRIFR|nr:hypothetical protein A0H81_13395 [Grifola frondosa]